MVCMDHDKWCQHVSVGHSGMARYVEWVCLLPYISGRVGVSTNRCKRESGRVGCILLDVENGVCLLLRAAVQ